MRNKVFVRLSIGLLLLGLAGVAESTLIGDSVTSQHFFPDINTPTSNLAQTIVTADSTDAMDPNNSIYTVDVGASNIFIEYIVSQTINWDINGDFNGVIIDSLNDSTTNPLQAVSVSTNDLNWVDSMIFFDSDTVYLNFLPSQIIPPGTYYDISLDFNPAAVPEPSSILLMATSLAGLGFASRKKKQA